MLCIRSNAETGDKSLVCEEFARMEVAGREGVKDGGVYRNGHRKAVRKFMCHHEIFLRPIT
jgi:hypothetical protein